MKFKYIKSILFLLLCSITLTTSNIYINTASAETVQAVQKAGPATSQCGIVKPLDVVKEPKAYLNKTITMDARFDKFATLGLDYKPAYKSSEEYITFLIKRDDTVYDIPLSEMKLFIKRAEAEKFIDLKNEDEIQVTGTVFSDALGDAWVDVKSIKIIKKAPDKNGVK